jgi:hypothetical protein
MAFGFEEWHANFCTLDDGEHINEPNIQTHLYAKVLEFKNLLVVSLSIYILISNCYWITIEH